MIETRVLVCGGRDADIDPSIADICISEIIEEFAPIDENEYTLFDEKSPWKRKTITNYTFRKMLHPIFI